MAYTFHILACIAADEAPGPHKNIPASDNRHQDRQDADIAWALARLNIGRRCRKVGCRGAIRFQVVLPSADQLINGRRAYKWLQVAAFQRFRPQAKGLALSS